MNYQYLTLAETLRLHFRVIEDYGGAHGVRRGVSLLSIIESPKQFVFEVEQYSTVFEKAAVYMRNIIGDHPFVDGNKRTALVVAAIFLGRNGRVLIADPKVLEDFVVTISTDHLSVDAIAVWLDQHSA